MSSRCHKRFQLPTGIVLALLAVVSIWTAAEETHANDQLPPKSEVEKGIVTDRPSPPIGPPAAIEGFRQARFGMSEEQVRQAIRNEFPAAAAEITRTLHPSEKTMVLFLTLVDLLPDTGNARISYIFGYRSKKLIQVNVIWVSNHGAPSDEIVVATANSLRDYLASQNYKPENSIVNRQVSQNTIVVFRANDSQGRTVLLVLSGVPAAARTEKTAPLMLELSYIEDAAHPDVFRIGKGEF